MPGSSSEERGSADLFLPRCVEVFPASSSLGTRDGETCGEDEMNGAEANVLVAVALGVATAQIIAAVILALLFYFTFHK